MGLEGHVGTGGAGIPHRHGQQGGHDNGEATHGVDVVGAECGAICVCGVVCLTDSKAKCGGMMGQGVRAHSTTTYCVEQRCCKVA